MQGIYHHVNQATRVQVMEDTDQVTGSLQDKLKSDCAGSDYEFFASTDY